MRLRHCVAAIGCCLLGIAGRRRVCDGGRRRVVAAQRSLRAGDQAQLAPPARGQPRPMSWKPMSAYWQPAVAARRPAGGRGGRRSCSVSAVPLVADRLRGEWLKRLGQRSVAGQEFEREYPALVARRSEIGRYALQSRLARRRSGNARRRPSELVARSDAARRPATPVLRSTASSAGQCRRGRDLRQRLRRAGGNRSDSSARENHRRAVCRPNRQPDAGTLGAHRRGPGGLSATS
ncbi:MAG: hypothetical protein MZV65_43905 [Chromatiales bacterium]|nr:hypothetical protein [Chromatiales bacterium]